MLERDTLAIVGEGICGYEDAVSFPIFQTSTFGGDGDFSYTRCSNPTRSALERQLAALEYGKYALAFSSGLGAVNAVFSLLSKSDRVIVSDDIYGGTYRLITEIYSKYGIEFVFVDMTDLSSLERAVAGGARMVFAESPTNPMMKVLPLADIARVCKSVGALFVVDNTFLTPYFQNPLRLGADIVLHSSTKFLSGHHDTVSGALVTNNAPLAERLSLISRTLGNALSPFDCWLTLRGIRTLPLRMKKHEENAIALANFLQFLPEVERVYYPALESHEGHELCRAQSRGFGGVVTFSLKDVSSVSGLKKGGRIVKYAESLGGFRTLITHPVTQTHASMPEEIRKKTGITDRVMRLSVGLESAKDIKEDILDLLRG